MEKNLKKNIVDDDYINCDNNGNNNNNNNKAKNGLKKGRKKGEDVPCVW
jgi:hypothetical protein